MSEFAVSAGAPGAVLPLLIMIAAMALDALLGDPDWLARAPFHPHRLFADAANWAESRLNRPNRSPINRQVRGALFIFALIGAAIGHVVMGYPLSFLSMFGLVALTGVVVNDSLILVDLVNKERGRHPTLVATVVYAASLRFRPIVFTTLTTFLGLSPLLVEKSVQAQFLIPMAISLAYGLVFATVITLLLVPCLYAILEDLGSLFGSTEGSSGTESHTMLMTVSAPTMPQNR